ncbi:AMP-dependent synthetase/ligase [Syntrophomonas zehnderi OL-4]|uniref:AMP-dependent synthetase/ligase n=1 Tax=Syntrophomonas zehnderi OL-4 TaxID=690567 RepID=A0A0E4C930_9FIRM|nr:AMP-binding protein [Syntrophomonas zehnderi]CFX83767.1 AMP-dependent synthetase/ligase [Syntrophomonas zehnderi OL-4]
MEVKAWERFWEKSWTDVWVKEGYQHGKDPLFHILYNNSLRNRHRTALIYYGTVITWDELRDQIMRAAGGLQKLGVEKGDRVYLGMQNCPQFVISYFAAHMLGAIVMAISPAYKEGEVNFVLNNSESKVMIIEESVVPVVNQIRTNIPSVKHIIVTSLEEYLPEDPYPAFPADPNGKGIECPGAIAWKDLIANEPLKKMADVDVNDVALLQYTSGTTGHPKGAMLTHLNLLNGAFVQAVQPYNTVDSVLVAVLPLFHITSMNDHMLAWAFGGNTMVLLARFDPETWMQAVERYQGTYSIVATPVVIAISNHPSFGKYDITSLHNFGIGGATLPQAVFNKYKDLGITLFEGYGMSETTATTAFNPNDAVKLGSIGLPVPQVDLRIADINDLNRDVAIGEEGELWVKTPSSGIGYWNDPEGSKETFLGDGWVRTGDIVKMDEDGYLYICGRLKEMIKSSAYSVFPAEVEEYMYAHPAILECCVIGTPHKVKGEEVKAFVVLKADWKGKITEAELIEWAKSQMAPYKYPRHIEFRDSLPKGNTGKIMRKVLKEEEAAKSAQK